jgi:hypothetical protein
MSRIRAEVVNEAVAALIPNAPARRQDGLGATECGESRRQEESQGLAGLTEH